VLCADVPLRNCLVTLPDRHTYITVVPRLIGISRVDGRRFAALDCLAVVKVKGGRGGLTPPLLRLWRSLAPLLESEPSLSTAGPKLLNSTKNHNVRCRINKF